MDSKILELIQKLAACQAMCNHCFNACLDEEDVQMMTRCIKLDKECAEICGVTLSLIASESNVSKEMARLCMAACEECAEECKKHSFQHCQECAKACEECVEACNTYI